MILKLIVAIPQFQGNESQLLVCTFNFPQTNLSRLCKYFNIENSLKEYIKDIKITCHIGCLRK